MPGRGNVGEKAWNMVERVYDDFFDFELVGQKFTVRRIEKSDNEASKRAKHDEKLYFAVTSGSSSTNRSVVEVSSCTLLQNVGFFRRFFADEQSESGLVLSPFQFDPAILAVFEAIFNRGHVILFSPRAILEGSAIRYACDYSSHILMHDN